MNPIGKIRIKSFGKLLPSNNLYLSNETLDPHFKSNPTNPEVCNGNVGETVETLYSNTECVENIKFIPATLKIKSANNDPCLVDCIDLTADIFETPVRKNTSRNICSKRVKNINSINSKVKNTKSKIEKKTSLVARSFAATPKNDDFTQSNLLSFFTASSTVKRAPKKIRKPPEKNKDTNSHIGAVSPRKLKKRNILNENDESCLINKSKTEIEKKSTKLNCSKSGKNSKHLKELKNVTETTVIPGVIDLCLDCESEEDVKVKSNSSITQPKRPVTVKSEKSICPSYKVIEGTTFAVDGFKFGRIEGVTAYFLSHFHSDHYIGMTRKFSMPLYVSQITANLMREFIPVNEKYINILPLNITTTIKDVKVTAIDANHCPGAVMFLFELPCGRRILHTGDFRASVEMESDLHLSQRNIDLLYLDTTYISHNYSFQTQEKSINDALKYIREFKERNEGKRILFVVGAYLVGKEKFWLPIAKEFDFKIWTDSNRRKILHAIDNKEILQRLTSKSRDADMHIISMMKVGYRGIETYWQDHYDGYDMIFAIRPSGWEKNSRPQFRGQLNIVGIEYSEHSSHNELRRFLSFLKPQQVISTVPYGKDQTKCPVVPLSWYKKECFSPIKKQASLLDYFKSSKIDNKIS